MDRTERVTSKPSTKPSMPYNAKTGYDILIHVDAASGGFILPFLYPEKKWDFRLKWVLSISVSGHKFGLGLSGSGLGFAGKAREYLPEEMSFSVKLPRCQHYSGRPETSPVLPHRFWVNITSSSVWDSRVTRKYSTTL